MDKAPPADQLWKDGRLMCPADLELTASVLPRDTDCTDAASRPWIGTDQCAIPAKAGIHRWCTTMDPGSRKRVRVDDFPYQSKSFMHAVATIIRAHPTHPRSSVLPLDRSANVDGGRQVINF